MSEPHSVAVTEQNNALRKAIREDWEEGFEIARRGLHPTSFFNGCRTLLIALAVSILLAVAVGLFHADDENDFPVGAFVPVLIVAIILPCVLACLYRTPEKPASMLPRSFEITPRKLPVGDDLGETGIYRSGLTEELLSGYNGATTLREVFENAVAINPSAKCQGTRPIERKVTQTVTFKNRDGEDVTRSVEKWVMAPEYSWKTYSEVAAAVTAVGAGLYNKLEELSANATEEEPMPFKRVGIFAETKAEWAQTAFGAFRHGIPIITVYATLGPDAVAYAVTQTGVSVMVADADLLQVIASCKAGRQVPTGNGDETYDAHCRSLKTVVYIGSEADLDAASAEALQAAGVEVIAFEALAASGKAAPVADTEETKPTPDSIANIQYTSGSTGLPKGVVIRHKHLVAGVAGVGASLPQLSPEDRYIAYLPLAHILELLAELTLYSRGASVGYATKDTLVASSQRIPVADEEAGIPLVKGDGAVLCPTVMAAVPAIMEKIRRGISAKVAAKGGLVSWLFKTGFARKSEALAAGNKSPFWDRLLFDKIRTEALGGRVRMMISGGGPLNKETQQFMNVVFNCPVGQGYGLTESMGAGTIVWPHDREFGLVGPPVQSVDIKLRDWPEGGYFTKVDPPRGEVMLSGGVVADGYYELPEKTASDFITGADGRVWFCTGDIGEFNEQGVLRIVDRKKDLVKLVTGEYISLGKIESTMLLCPYITAIMAYGDGEASAAVVVVTPDVAAIRAKFPDLAAIEDMAVSADVKKLILDDLKRIAKAKHFPKLETPSKVLIATEEWTPESGLVTASLKLKRKALMDKYKDELVALYGRGGAAAQ